MIDAAPTTVAPAARATSIVSRVDPPVVTTSSTTSTRSLGSKRETAPQAQRPVLPLGEDRAHAERPADLLADDDAAERRRQHDVGTKRRARASASAAPQASASRGCCSTSAHCRYPGLCSPEVSRK